MQTSIRRKINRIYSTILRRFIKLLFPIGQKLGFHITPNHYYQPIPDTRTLGDNVWQKESELVGINIHEENQISLLSLFSSKYKGEYESFPRNKTQVLHQYYLYNASFGSVDGEVLYCMIRHFKPKNVFEIGSGSSTLLSAQALLKNKEETGHGCNLVAFEPYPNDILKIGFPCLTKLVQKKVQDVSLSEFGALKENDILFIDSSHVLKIGGDVQFEYLEVLPRLNKGVIVHIHDIFLPLEYKKEWVLKEHIFFTEQYLLQAFLAFNDSFEILWAGSYMHLRYPDTLEMAFTSYKRNETWPGSFWIRKKI